MENACNYDSASQDFVPPLREAVPPAALTCSVKQPWQESTLQHCYQARDSRKDAKTQRTRSISVRISAANTVPAGHCGSAFASSAPLREISKHYPLLTLKSPRVFKIYPFVAISRRACAGCDAPAVIGTGRLTGMPCDGGHSARSIGGNAISPGIVEGSGGPRAVVRGQSVRQAHRVRRGFAPVVRRTDPPRTSRRRPMGVVRHADAIADERTGSAAAR